MKAWGRQIGLSSLPGPKWLVSTIVGAVLGYAVLHPVTMVIFRLDHGPPMGDVESFLAEMTKSFGLRMTYMSLHFVALGSLFGFSIGKILNRLDKQRGIIQKQQATLRGNIARLLEKGESEAVEFKSTLRWDLKLGRLNRAVEHAVLKTIAGFMNSRGGTLLLGVDDRGKPLGLATDISTLKRKDVDGFEQCLMQGVVTHLGAHLCPWVHVVFGQADGHAVCCVLVEPVPEPVYLSDGRNQQFFLRAGNGTRELNVEEAIRYISNHWQRSHFTR